MQQINFDNRNQTKKKSVKRKESKNNKTFITVMKFQHKLTLNKNKTFKY